MTRIMIYVISLVGGYYMPPRPTAETGAIMFGSTNVKWNPGGMRLSEVYLMIAECYAKKG